MGGRRDCIPAENGRRRVESGFVNRMISSQLLQPLFHIARSREERTECPESAQGCHYHGWSICRTHRSPNPHMYVCATLRSPRHRPSPSDLLSPPCVGDRIFILPLTDLWNAEHYDILRIESRSYTCQSLKFMPFNRDRTLPVDKYTRLHPFSTFS